MSGRPLKSMLPLGGGCQGKTRSGQPCRSLLVYRCKNGSLRCRWHAGRSTGPKTPEGRRRSGENLRRWRESKRTEQHGSNGT